LLPGSDAFTTSPGFDGTVIPGFVLVPWLQLAMVLVGVPLLAASVAALAVRRIPTMTRRLG